MMCNCGHSTALHYPIGPGQWAQCKHEDEDGCHQFQDAHQAPVRHRHQDFYDAVNEERI